MNNSMNNCEQKRTIKNNPELYRDNPIIKKSLHHDVNIFSDFVKKICRFFSIFSELVSVKTPRCQRGSRNI